MHSYSALAIATITASVLVSAAPVHLISGPVESLPVSSYGCYPGLSGLHHVCDDELFELLAHGTEANEAQHATTGAPKTHEDKLGEHAAVQTRAHLHQFTTNSEHEHSTSEESAGHGAAHSCLHSGECAAAHSQSQSGEHAAAHSRLHKGEHATAHSHLHEGEHAAAAHSHLHFGEHASEHAYSKSGKSTHRYGKNAKGKYAHKGIDMHQGEHAAHNGLKAHKGEFAANGGEHASAHRGVHTAVHEHENSGTHTTQHTGEHSNEYGASTGSHAHSRAYSVQREHDHGPTKTGTAHSSESSIPTMHQHEARGKLSKASHLLNHVSNSANAVLSTGDAWQSVKQVVHHCHSPELKNDKLHKVGKAAGITGDIVNAASSVTGVWQSFHSREDPYEFLYERDYELDDLE